MDDDLTAPGACRYAPAACRTADDRSVVSRHSTRPPLLRRVALRSVGFLLAASLAGCASSGDGSSGSAPSGGPGGAAPGATGKESRPPAAVQFTVQLGAYVSEEAAGTVSALAKTRFAREIVTVFDRVDGLHKVMLGVFETKEAARNFRDTIVRQYPGEYNDAWVSERPR